MAQTESHGSRPSEGRRGGAVDTKDDGRHTGMTPAQWYCLLAGAALLLAGLFGWIADASFDTSTTRDTDVGGNADGMLQGDSFLGFEVNGWHNLVHLLSGLVLLAVFRSRKAAKTVAIAFGLVYGLVALIGLVDGNDVLGIIPVNAADNVLHIALSLAGILAGLVSPTDEHRHTDRGDDARRATPGSPLDTPAGRATTAPASEARFGRDRDTLTGRPRDDRSITGR